MLASPLNRAGSRDARPATCVSGSRNSGARPLSPRRDIAPPDHSTETESDSESEGEAQLQAVQTASRVSSARRPETIPPRRLSLAETQPRSSEQAEQDGSARTPPGSPESIFSRGWETALSEFAQECGDLRC